MSLWSDFIDTISVRAKEAVNTGIQGMSDVLGGFTASTAAKTLTPENPAQTDKAIRQEAQRVLAENKKFDINQSQKSNDLILKTAVALNDKVISPLVTRPVSTVGLLTDPTSPLYQPGEYQAGFQVKDIVDAYNRSAMVSPMQALTKSALLHDSLLQKAVGEFGNIDFNEVNLWNDKSVEKNYSENVVGRWYTGLGDFVVGNAALGAAGKLVGGGAKMAKKASGLSAEGKTVADFATDIEEGFKWADSNGTAGRQTIAASHMQELADSKDYATISTLADKYSTNSRIVPLLYQATDRNVVKDIILADKGNVDAMIRLADTAPDQLFELGDVAGQIKARTLLDGELFIPEGPAVDRLAKAYEAAIKANPKYDELRKAFLDDNYKPIVGGRVDYIPVEPKVLTSPFITAEKGLRALKAASVYRDFGSNGLIHELNIAGRPGQAATKFIKIELSRSTGNMPLGFVTFSGMRPMDGYKELNAFLDNLELFRDGSKVIEVQPNVFKKVADVRKGFEADYFKSTEQIDQVKALESIDEQIGLMLAYNNGWYETGKIQALIADYRAKMARGAKAFQENGYSVDHQGVRMTTNAQTLRQLAESYRFTPWNEIEREFIRQGMKNIKAGRSAAGQFTKSVYEDLQRAWTFDVLARPMFIAKQSILEPLITVGLAAGADEVRSATKNLTMRGLTAGWNKTVGLGRRLYKRSELKAINEAVTIKQQALSKAIGIKDQLQAEYESLLSTGSVAVREQHLPQVKRELKAAEKLVDNLELDYLSAVKPFGLKDSIPSVTLLERRIAYLESLKNPKYGAEIANAKAAIAAHKGTLNSMATNRKVIQEAEDRIAAAYDDIDNAVKELSEKRQMQADTFGKSEAYRKEYIGRTQQYRMVNGQWTSIDSFVNDATGNNFARAIRGEVANASTTELNYISDISVGTRKALINRKVPNIPIDTTNPIYYQELAHVANDLIRRDPLMDLILAETPAEDLYRWGLTSEGRSYLGVFGVESVDSIPTYINEKIALIKRTFPSVEARAAILEREVKPVELQKMLAPYEAELFEIAPSDWAYADRAILGSNQWYKSLENAIGSATAWTFKKLTSPENPIRESLFDKIAVDKVAEKAKVLIDQGIDMTPKQWNAIRQSAGREALQELEKTIYTVRRQNRAFHAARVAVAFPTASFSAFYRYGRLAVKNPQRVAGFLYNYQRGFRTFGVDKNGNPTRNIDEITHLIVPGTKELGLGIYDEGIALNARSLGFMLNSATPSFISALSVGKLMRKFNSAEEWTKSALGPLYDVWFPYGPPTSLKQQLTPIWANAVWNAVTQDKGKKDYLASYQSVYDYHKMLVEMGVEKKFPTEGQLDWETRKLWEQKARWAFISPAGVPIKVQTNRMDVVDTLWYTLMNKYQSLGNSYDEASKLAGDEMLATLGSKFIVDRVSFNPSTVRLNVPETVDAWNVIFKDNKELVTELANIRGIDNPDIRLVGLLTADMKVNYEDRNTMVAQRLKDPSLTLPGTSKLINALKMQPEEIEKIRLKNRTWKEYTGIRKALEAKITDGKPLRSHPGLKQLLDYAAETYLKNKNEDWYNEYSRGANGDSGYEYAKAFSTIASNKKFMDKNISSPFWQDVIKFNAIRNVAVGLYNSLPEGDSRKAKLKEAYLVYIASQAQGFHPELRRIIEQTFDNDNMKVAN